MQSGNDCAVRERKLSFPVGLDRYIVAQDGTQTVEVACFMGRGNPLPVAVPVGNFGDEGGGLAIRVSRYRLDGSVGASGCGAGERFAGEELARC
jgi:hypothetical protein